MESVTIGRLTAVSTILTGSGIDWGILFSTRPEITRMMNKGESGMGQIGTGTGIVTKSLSIYFITGSGKTFKLDWLLNQMRRKYW